MQPQWHRICSIDDIPMLGARVVTRTGQPNVAIFRSEENKIFALLDRCPHKGGPLSQGIVFGERVACPLHNWNVELQTGCAMAPDVGCARKFSMKIDNGQIFLDANELNGVAVEAA